jgi:multiple sugar transport system permease protein
MTDVTLSPGKAVAAVKRPTGASIGPRWSNALFVAPYLVFYLVLLVYPLFKGIWMSMLQSDMFDDTSKFAGLANYHRLFNDKIFIGTVWNTFLFVVMTVPVFVAIGLLLALALNRSDRTAATLRAIFFGTSVLSVTIVTIIWKMMYMPGNGAIASIFKVLGLPPVAFITSSSLALVAIAICTIWWIIGLPMMLFLAALQQIPGELYEAAPSTTPAAGARSGRSPCRRSAAPCWSSSSTRSSPSSSCSARPSCSPRAAPTMRLARSFSSYTSRASAPGTSATPPPPRKSCS